jgi:hypothetical protein
MNLSAYEQHKKLHEQKYPKAGPGVFKMPYYASGLAGMRSYFKSGNNRAEVQEALDRAAVLKPPGKAAHNARILNQFLGSSFSTRVFTNITLSTKLIGVPGQDVEIRLKFDFEGDEKGKRKFVFFNCRDVPLDPDVAQSAITIAHWVFNENKLSVPIKDIEFVDLKTGINVTISKPSAKTIKMMKANAAIISSWWPNI